MKKIVMEKKKERPTWAKYFVNIVIETLQRSSCIKRDVGAIIVKDNMILATGYNGAPRGIKSCYEKGYCWRRKQRIPHGRDKDLCMAAHAEANAIYQAARKGIAVEGAILYVTIFPCPACSKAIINSGLIEVNYLFGYYGKQYKFARELLKEAGIKTKKLQINLEKILKENPNLNLR